MKIFDIYDLLMRSRIISLASSCGMMNIRKDKFYRIAKFHREYPTMHWIDACLELRCEKSEYYAALRAMNEDVSLSDEQIQLIELLKKIAAD